MEASERARRAQQCFCDGCNCPQAVVGAFGDVLEAVGIDARAAVRLASPFGGGMGRLREVCGAFSGMLVVLGAVRGYDDPADGEAKARLYGQVQQLAARFERENGALLCRDLLGLGDGASAPVPSERTADFYASRPCARICANAARILAEELGEGER